MFGARVSTDRERSRFRSSKFQDAQDVSSNLRREVTHVLGLSEWDADYIQVNQKLDKHNEVMRDFERMYIVTPVKGKTNVVPFNVIRKARGVVLYRDDNGKYRIIRKSIPYNYDVIMDTLGDTGMVNLYEIDSETEKPNGNKYAANFENFTITQYMEGSTLYVMKVDGIMRYFTSTNLLAEGINVDGVWLTKPAAWGKHHEPIIETFRRVCQKVDPRLLDVDELFPAEYPTSNYAYSFIVVSRDRVRADSYPICEGGSLVYLGCKDQTDTGTQKPPSFSIAGTVRRVPAFATDSYILYNPDSLTRKEANEWLLSTNLQTGNKLVATNNITRLSFHIKPRTYAFRQSILGNDSDLYRSFLQMFSSTRFEYPPGMGYKSFNGVPYVHVDGIEKLQSSNVDDYLEVIQRMLAEGTMTLSPGGETYALKNRTINMWVVFAACCNRSIQHQTKNYLQRFEFDVTNVISWFEPKHKSKQRTLVKMKFVWNTQRDNLTAESFLSYLVSNNDDSLRMIKYANEALGTKFDSIKVTDTSFIFTRK